jgi:hypothetical protein
LGFFACISPIKPLGHAELADPLLHRMLQPFARRLQSDIARTRTLLDVAPIGDVEKVSAMGGLDHPARRGAIYHWRRLKQRQ